MLTITRASASKHQARLAAADGTLIDCYEADLLSSRAQQRLAQATGLTTAVIAAAAVRVRDAAPVQGEPKPSERIAFTVPTNPTRDAPARLVRVAVRGRTSDSRTAKVFAHATAEGAFQCALDYTDCPHRAPEIECDDLDHIALLDVDYHEAGRKPDPTRLRMAASSVAFEIGVSWWWVTHGGGLRFVLTARAGFRAAELAALCKLSFLDHARRWGVLWCTGIETKRTTSHPRYPRYADGAELRCGDVCRGAGLPDLRGVATALIGGRLTPDPDAITDYLDEHGMHFGQKLKHDRCPFDPSPSGSDATRPPVVVLPPEDEKPGGLWCHKCQRLKPFAALLAPEKCHAERENALRQCVKGMAHYAHARHVVEHYAPMGSSDERKSLYGALLRLWHIHGPTELDETQSEAVQSLINAALSFDVPIVRVEGGWLNTGDDAPPANEAFTRFVHILPATKYVGKEGEVCASSLAVAKLMNSDDAAAATVGYAPLRPLGPVDWFGAIGDRELVGPVPCRFPRGLRPFRYRRPEERYLVGMPAWQVLEQNFPGVDRNYLRLCMGGIAFTQKPGKTEADRVYVKGQSKSGKTTTAVLAAELCGVRTSAVKLKADEDKLIRAAVNSAGGIMFLDELTKSKLTGEEMQSRIQSITVGAEYHQLHRGSARLTRLPFVVAGDTDVPRVFDEEIQLRRRFVFVQLGAANPHEWEETSGGVVGWRERGPLGYSLPELGADIADAIVSGVIDEIRTLVKAHGSGANFQMYARSLGYDLMSKTETDVDHEQPYRDLFDAVMKAEPTKNSKFQGDGWVVFERRGECPVAKTWRACAGTEGFDGPKRQLITGRQWAVTTGVTGLECDLNEHGVKVGLRFRVGRLRSPGVKYHKAVLGGSGVGGAG